MSAPRLPRAIFQRPSPEVAVDLLGASLHFEHDQTTLVGIIVETEAYCGGEGRDLACHGDKANGGNATPRTSVMFGEAGHAFVYFTYGMHWMFNVVCGQLGEASAVLIRAVEPTLGLDTMRSRRNNTQTIKLTNGPAKLAQSFAIDSSHNNLDLCLSDSPIALRANAPIPSHTISSGPRIGIGATPEPWKSIPWRYWITDNPFVSRIPSADRRYHEQATT